MNTAFQLYCESNPPTIHVWPFAEKLLVADNLEVESPISVLLPRLYVAKQLLIGGGGALGLSELMS